jgi:hypothetical protein
MRIYRPRAHGILRVSRAAVVPKKVKHGGAVTIIPVNPQGHKTRSLPALGRLKPIKFL